MSSRAAMRPCAAMRPWLLVVGAVLGCGELDGDGARVAPQGGAAASANVPLPPAAISVADPPTSSRLVPRSAEARSATLDLVFVGDVVLGEYFLGSHRSLAGSQAVGDPFAAVSSLLQADVVVGNLESPVVRQVPVKSPFSDGHRFGGSAEAVESLARAGFNVMSVANNHATDLGVDGLEQTPRILRARGITPIGPARPDDSPFRVDTVVRSGWKIGLVAATTWVNHRAQSGAPTMPLVRAGSVATTLSPVVRLARADHDLVIVLLHWGQERRERPSSIQIHAARALIDAGADLVIGHHPHVLQGVERYQGRLIAYSLGNFLFPAWNEEYRDTAVLRVGVRARGDGAVLVAAALTAVRVGKAPAYAPFVATGREAAQIYKRVRRLSRGLRTRWRVDEGLLVLDGLGGRASG